MTIVSRKFSEMIKVLAKPKKDAEMIQHVIAPDKA